MKLAELSMQYLDQYCALKKRIDYLNGLSGTQTDPNERFRMGQRIRMLTAMKIEAGQLAAITGRYYERGYRKNEKYTL
ncbi:MAG: hypothetical protein E7430_10700 [Ruminococcaceae bacterium]|nr:hypothetical protein [Oscillospiraceae bacterium]